MEKGEYLKDDVNLDGVEPSSIGDHEIIEALAAGIVDRDHKLDLAKQFIKNAVQKNRLLRDRNTELNKNLMTSNLKNRELEARLERSEKTDKLNSSLKSTQNFICTLRIIYELHEEKQNFILVYENGFFYFISGETS